VNNDLLKITDWGKNELLRLREISAAPQAYEAFWDQYHEKLIAWNNLNVIEDRAANQIHWGKQLDRILKNFVRNTSRSTPEKQLIGLIKSIGKIKESMLSEVKQYADTLEEQTNATANSADQAKS
jgi:hypothetical protein